MLSSPPACCYFEPRSDGSVDRLAKWSLGTWSTACGEDPGFHLPHVNPLLVKHLPRLLGERQGADRQPSILVPLCGKTHDMLYLCKQGFGVVGVEGVARAIREFKAEQRCQGLQGFGPPKAVSFGRNGWGEGVDFEAAQEFRGYRSGCVFKKGSRGLGYYRDSPRLWQGEVFSLQGSELTSRPLHVIQGDLFEVTPALVAGTTFVRGGTFDLVYDRGSIVAVPPSAREQYVAVLSDLLKPCGRILMMTLDYDQSQVQGPPPFSISLRDIQQLFPSDAWMVEVLDEPASDLPETNPKFCGVLVTERVVLVTRRPPGNGGARSLLALWGWPRTARGP